MDLSHVIDIANVSIKRSASDHELISVKQFFQISIQERMVLVKDNKVEFIDFEGNKIPTMDGLKQISKLVKYLNSNGLLKEFKKA